MLYKPQRVLFAYLGETIDSAILLVRRQCVPVARCAAAAVCVCSVCSVLCVCLKAAYDLKLRRV